MNELEGGLEIKLNVWPKETTAEDAHKEKVGQDQIQGLLFGEQLSWQAIIYDLINTEQLDPWDIDLVALSNKYLEKIRELEEANLFISSKVLFAASLLLRIKTEILLSRYIPSLDEILFGKKEEKKYIQERIELEEDIPGLIQRTPLPRFRKVTLQELMAALGKAVKTENRRIGRVVLLKQQELETATALPRGRINLKTKINEVYSLIKEIFSNKKERLAFSKISGIKDEDRINTFIPLLHLDYQHKVLLEQDKHFEEIWIWLKKLYEERYKDELEAMKKETELALARELLEKEQEKNDLDEKDQEKKEGKNRKAKLESSAEKDSREEISVSLFQEEWEDSEAEDFAEKQTFRETKETFVDRNEE